VVHQRVQERRIRWDGFGAQAKRGKFPTGVIVGISMEQHANKLYLTIEPQQTKWEERDNFRYVRLGKFLIYSMEE
jgi:hypothetical protein